jgi:4-hydroxy-tetrahydrodipicolinate synthase
LLIVPQYYMAPTPAQVMDHYRRIANAVSIPIVVYHNIPLTSVDLTTDHLLKLYQEKVIGGVKMSHPEPDRQCQLLQATDGGFAVYAGIDTAAFAWFARLDFRNPQHSSASGAAPVRTHCHRRKSA